MASSPFPQSIVMSLIVFCCFTTVEAYQTNKLTPESDTSSINAQISRARQYRYVNTDSALYFATSAIRSARQIKSVHHEALASNIFGLLLMDNGNYDSAIRVMTRSVQLFDHAKRFQNRANGYNNLGLIWLSKGDTEKAMSFFDTALDYYVSTKDTLEIAYTFLNTGYCYRQAGSYRLAAEEYLKAIEIFEKYKDEKDNLGTGYTNLSIVFRILKDYNRALFYQRRSLLINIETNDVHGVAVCNLNIGSILLDQEKFDSSIWYSRRALSSFQAISYPVGIAASAHNIGQAYISLEQPDSTWSILRLGNAILKTIDHPEGEVKFNNLYARYFLQKKEYHQAVRYAKKSLEMNNNRFPDDQKDTHQFLSQAYEKLGNYSAALVAHKLFKQEEDSVFAREKIAGIYDLERQMEVKKKQLKVDQLQSEAKIASLELANERSSKKYYAVGVGSLVIVVFLLIYSGKTKSKLLNRIKGQNEKLEHMNQVFEIKALRSRIDPHFVFNALTGVQHFINLGIHEIALEHLSKVSNLIRSILQKSTYDLITIEEEVKLAKLYLEIEQFRFGNNFTFEIDIEPSLKEKLIPLMIIHPFVENAVLHGVTPLRDRKGHILIRVHDPGDVVLIEIHDNGIGRKVASTNYHEGFDSMGTALIDERLGKFSILMGKEIKFFLYDKTNADGSSAGTLASIVLSKENDFSGKDLHDFEYLTVFTPSNVTGK
jgi:tetratricopeptide (TPR) repeat protein